MAGSGGAGGDDPGPAEDVQGTEPEEGPTDGKAPEETGDARSPEEDRAPDVGVLFVHGIGEQARGETLVRWGDTLTEFLDKWLKGRAENEPAKIDEHERDILVSKVATHLPEYEDAPPMARAILGQRIEMELKDEPEYGPRIRERRATVTSGSIVGDGVPPHARLRLRTKDARDDGDADERHWLMAEGYWADTVSPPAYGDLVRWAFRTLPWTVVAHMGRWLRRRVKEVKDKEWWKLLRSAFFAALAFLLAFVLIPILVAATVAVLLIGAIPHPAVRVFTARVQRLLSATVGDSYVLLESPVQRGAILSRVYDAYDWLRERVDNVVIVAHSQGAAIAHEALRSRPQMRPAGLLTFGSGLSKLTEIRLIKHTRYGWIPWVPVAGLGLLALVAPALWAQLSNRQLLLLVAFVVGAAALLTLAAAKESRQPRVSSTSGGQRPRLRDLVLDATVTLVVPLAYVVVSIPSLMPGVTGWTRSVLMAGLALFIVGISVVLYQTRAPPKAEYRIDRPTEDYLLGWLDIYATADPVPNGRLLDEPDRVLVESEHVHNRASVVSDHTTYWQNPEEFTVRVARYIDERDPRGESLGIDDEALEKPRQRRRWRLRWLVAGRVVALLAASTVAFGLARRGISPDLAATVTQWIRNVAGFLLIPSEWISPDLGGSALLHVAAVVFGALLAFLLVYLTLWKWWEHADRKAFYTRSDQSRNLVPFVLYMDTLGLALIGSIAYVVESSSVVAGAPYFALGSVALAGTTAILAVAGRTLDGTMAVVRNAAIVVVSLLVGSAPALLVAYNLGGWTSLTETAAAMAPIAALGGLVLLGLPMAARIGWANNALERLGQAAGQPAHGGERGAEEATA